MTFRVLVVAPLILLAACESARTLRQSVVGATPHERYAGSLRDAGLQETALGQAWVAAAERSVGGPAPAVLPFRETGLFSATEPGAVAYRFAIVRGQRVSVELDFVSDEPARVFLDLYEIPRDSAAPPRHLLSAGSGEFSLGYEPRRDAELVVRIQPELLRTVRWSVEVRSGASLAFPVGGRDTRAVGSRFGASRDGGRREHHGIDIFAPRGTPVLAASDGVVRRTGTNRLGGNVVWLSDSRRGISQYYAHLDTQLVTAGVRVRAGDTLGLVGNTGNARSTPPHLHFGIYASGQGPVDPWPFLYESRTLPPRVVADTSRLGRWSRASAAPQLVLRESPSERSTAAARLPRHTPLRVVAASGSFYRVELPDGTSGYVAARLTEPASAPIARQRVTATAAIYERPAPGALAMDSVAAGATLPVLARFGSYRMVDGGEGRVGWVAD